MRSHSRTAIDAAGARERRIRRDVAHARSRRPALDDRELDLQVFDARQHFLVAKLRGAARLRSATSRAAPASRDGPRNCWRCSRCALRDPGLRVVGSTGPGARPSANRSQRTRATASASRIELHAARRAARRCFSDAWRSVSVSAPARAPPAVAVGAQSRASRPSAEGVVGAFDGQAEIDGEIAPQSCAPAGSPRPARRCGRIALAQLAPPRRARRRAPGAARRIENP